MVLPEWLMTVLSVAKFLIDAVESLHLHAGGTVPPVPSNGK